jgi:hypothetical protein
MGLQPWVDFIGDPEIDVAENSHGLDSIIHLAPPVALVGKKSRLLSLAVRVAVSQAKF